MHRFIYNKNKKHNCVTWGTENPKAVHEVPIESLKVTVWFGMPFKAIIVHICF